ncbi:MAG: cell wall hydrolase [Gammaproteobacteria bacterium]|nr:cell wall hydrolase [Gammaproteobacteria bacterium]
MKTSAKKPTKEIISCPEGSCLVRAHDKKKKNKRGEPYIQHVHNYCRMMPNYFDNFCKTENPENPDLTYTILTAFGEARGESNESIKAIAWVMKNRKQIKKWKGTYKNIVLSERQFDCWNPSDKNYPTILRIIHHDKKEQETWEKCKKIIEVFLPPIDSILV